MTDRLATGRLGTVTWSWAGSGKRTVFNTLAYAVSGLIARAMAGDGNASPTHIGFIYGVDGSGIPTWVPGDRDLTWGGLASELAVTPGDPGFNMQISGISLTPSLTSVQNPGDFEGYVNNAVVFSAVTESGPGAELAFGGTAYDQSGLAGGCTVYSAVLLHKRGNVYTVLGRVNLDDSAFPVKSDDRELSVFWRVAFF